jgi:hypothetical protein
MANSTLSNLTATTALTSGDLLYVVDGGNSRKIDWDDVAAQLFTDMAQLPATTELTSGDLLYVVDGGNSRTIDWSDVVAQVNADQLGAISDSIAATAVDVFVYDTSKDSDGGAWRKRTQHTSWYNETLNTSTRGSRREFPAVAVIVAEAGKVTIYDGDDPSLPMWMVFTGGSDSNSFLYINDTTSVAAVNGAIAVGRSVVGVAVADFPADRAAGRRTLTSITYTGFISGLANRNVSNAWDKSPAVSTIVNNTVNDCAMTVLPDAPIDSATGLPVPTIAVGTAGGVSVINNDGTVADSTQTAGMASVAFDVDSRLFYSDDGSDQVYFADVYASDGFNSGGDHYDTDAAPYTLPGNVAQVLPGVLGQADGLTFLKENKASKTSGMAAFVTADYNTGWMPGDIKGAFLSDTDDTDLVGGTDADRSVNNNGLTVNGTVTRTAVATGADLVAYSGWSDSNYLEQPYNADLDFGTGDFCVMGWVNPVTFAFRQSYIFDRSEKIAVRADFATGAMRFFANSVSYGSSLTLSTGRWQFFTWSRISGTSYFYLNGVLEDSTPTLSGSVDDSGSFLVGRRGSPATDYWTGSLALLRISATALTADQIAKIYEDEKVLFQEDAAFTLYGASDAVTALAHDPMTNILSVGTSAGRSDFQGLRRVKNTTTAVGTAISASGGMIVEE